jgi:hypothetical protein
MPRERRFFVAEVVAWQQSVRHHSFRKLGKLRGVH